LARARSQPWHLREGPTCRTRALARRLPRRLRRARNRRPSRRRRFSSAFDRDDLPSLVVAAVRTDAMRQLRLTALRTDGPCGRAQRVVRAALAPAGLGGAPLWKGRDGALL